MTQLIPGTACNFLVRPLFVAELPHLSLPKALAFLELL
jgi:hypothetical protein